MIRSYPFKHVCNKGKLLHINQIHTEYKRVAGILMDRQINSFFNTGRLDESNKIYKDIETFLSERYKDVIKRQVDGMLTSYISNMKNNFRTFVYNSSIPDKIKKDLYKINLSNKWFDKDVIASKGRLANKIFRNILKRNRFPNTRNINMQLNTKLFSIEEAYNPKNSLYDNDESYNIKYWVKLCTNIAGKFIYIPLLENTYFESQIGKISNGIQLNFKNACLNNVVLTKEKTTSVTYKGSKKIGLDIGLRNLLTTSEGDIYSNGFINKLSYYDEKRLKIEREIKKRKEKLTENKRYNRVVHKQREYIKNESNRIINRIVEVHNPTEIVYENLNFKNSNLSRKMNRMLNNFGLSNINTKLFSINQELGIKLTKVSPVYTSMMCSSCGYIHQKNRKNEDFKCLHCGYVSHADINSTKNIMRRSDDGRMNIYTSKNKILRLLISDFVKSQQFCESSLSSAHLATNKYKNIYLELGKS